MEYPNTISRKFFGEEGEGQIHLKGKPILRRGEDIAFSIVPSSFYQYVWNNYEAIEKALKSGKMLRQMDEIEEFDKWNHSGGDIGLDYMARTKGPEVMGGAESYPVTVHVSNMRILGIRKGGIKPSLMLAGGLSTVFDGPPAYRLEKSMTGSHFCMELSYNDREFMLIVSDEFVGIAKTIQNVIGEPIPVEIQKLTMRRPIMIPQFIALIRYFEQQGIPVKYTESGKKRWLNLLERFQIEDYAGLGWFYTADGFPIFEEGEEITEERIATPFAYLVRREGHRNCLKRIAYKKRGKHLKFELTKPHPGTIYFTNKRFFFIRPIYDDDLHYLPDGFPEGTHVCFWFYLDDAKLKDDVDGNYYYDIFVDNDLNRIQVWLPDDEDAFLETHKKRENKRRLWLENPLEGL